MPGSDNLPNNLISFGPNSNCTLLLCPLQSSVYHYRPSLAASSIFIALFSIAFFIHAYQGYKWKQWTFGILCLWGCLLECVGYGARVILHRNPFSFGGFLTQIIMITIGPTFFTAAIYLTLAKIVIYLGPQHARFPASFYLWIFVPCDIISLVLQAVGGALSTQSSGKSNTAVGIAIAGLSFQVATLVVFIALSLEYAWRVRKARNMGQVEGERMASLPMKFKVFATFLSAAILLILIRCIYRIDELSNGYDGPLIHDQGTFIGLEGVMIIVAVFFLNIGHPGVAFGAQKMGFGGGKERAGVIEEPKV